MARKLGGQRQSGVTQVGERSEDVASGGGGGGFNEPASNEPWIKVVMNRIGIPHTAGHMPGEVRGESAHRIFGVVHAGW